MTNQNQEFIKSEIYKDIGDYKNMSQLALAKKLPYWLKIYNQSGKSFELLKIYHLRNYCRDCDKEKMFVVERFLTAYGNYKPFTRIIQSFWDSYREQYKKLYFEAVNHYKETSKANEEVQCPCGGHYKATNKAKHFKTQKHLLYLDKNEKSVLQI
jgi:hypothetical protein